MELEMDKQEEQQEKPKKIRRKKRSDDVKDERDAGIGLDVGTAFCISGKSVSDEAYFRVQRDAFFDVENNVQSRKMLNKLKANFMESEDKKNLYVIGEEALQMANFFNKEARRPLSHGCISTREKEALIMIKIILHGLLGDPIVENEICYFSVPARPLDQEHYNVVYHENILKSFITSFGYKAYPINEALAVAWADLEDDDYSGMALSFGAGMTNACLSFLGVSEKGHQFSVARGGDWIDINAATAVGLKASRITTLKETGVDLKDPHGREETAIKIYYENLIKYVCTALEKRLNQTEDVLNFPEPISVVVSGGTSKIKNFEVVFEEELRTKSFPFQIKRVVKAKDQLNAVAKGCLLNALNHEE